MNSASYLLSVRGASTDALDIIFMGILFLAVALGILLFRERTKHAPDVHSPKMAWLRAGLYFCGVYIISWLVGVLPAIATQPLASSEQLSDGSWLALTALCIAIFAWGYIFWWPRGTLTHGRELYFFPAALFGLLWGSASGLLLLSIYAILLGFGLPAWGAALVTLPIMAVYNMNYQLGWWDIHVSPPHNIRAWNNKKVLGSHNPFLIVTLLHLALFSNLALFVLIYALAMSASAVAMRFPPFWLPDGPRVSAETAIGE